MPELPEIETLKNSLENNIEGTKIDSVLVNRDKIRYPLQIDFARSILGRAILRVRRRAKYLVIDLSGNKSLVIHLGMSGRFILARSSYIAKKHDHIIIQLSTGESLVFNDARRFGMVYCYDTNLLDRQKIFHNLGKEPLSDEFNANYLIQILSNRKSPIKNVIMDARVVVGVGNIYASESLFNSSVNPTRTCCSLTFEEVENLVSSIKQILTEAIKEGGTSLKDFVNGDNKPGYFKQKLNVYARENKDCYRCANSIIKIRQAGRSTFFCPTCQG